MRMEPIIRFVDCNNPRLYRPRICGLTLMVEIADLFVEELHSNLDAAQLHNAICLNQTPEYENCCATHDYADTNQLLINAWKRLFDCEPSCEEEMDVLERAHEFAKDNDFFTNNYAGDFAYFIESRRLNPSIGFTYWESKLYCQVSEWNGWQMFKTSTRKCQYLSPFLETIERILYQEAYQLELFAD